ncbi:DUF1565 domain-containing protein [Calothrix sp. UHCC 0171]|uniref:DUF1565 domain-containing protein n=1 Tax=Calothrix sp. UHCC 0171 TaxID=3110245 RepID=UPI002B1EF9B7|nr:DUF1565 domain-containing protein [Calothrix sp. UHCC 0171]MEA5569884.1 DUF1565 domain-containing protein [Calothrix sp. UHCC 0171]
MYRTDVKSAHPVIKSHQSYRSLKIKFLKSFCHLSVLLLSFSIGVIGTTFVHASLESAIAQTPARIPKLPTQVEGGEKTISQVNVLFVNPSVGDDKAGNGSDGAPFRTISRAIEATVPNSTIVLAKGTYSVATGEVFPLILKPGVTIQGDVASKGRGTVIQGGDDYLSRSFGKQNTAIVAVNDSKVTGVTVTNPNRRGYGMLIESANAIISENIFAGCTQDGISITGNGTATISKNYFYQNKANGLTVSGNARPEISENIFQQTGFGINITQNAEPVVIGNQIQFNRAGIVVQANARPKLRKNQILGSREDGLVVIAQAMPDLGNAADKGENEFRNNARYDINANAAKQLLSAFGNNIASSRIAGNVNLSGNITAVAPISLASPPQPQTTQVTTSPNEITFTAPNAPAEANGKVSRSTRRNLLPLPKSPVSANPAVNSLNSQLMPLQAANSMLNTATSTSIPTPESSTNLQNSFPTPSSLSTYPQTTANTAQINYVRINPGTIEFSAPEAGINQVASATTQPLQPMQTMSVAPMPYNQSTLAAATGLRYRVIVPVTGERDEEVVRFLAPGAFRINRQGQALIQVGVFSNTFNAEQMLRVLNNNGLRGAIEPLN